MIDWLTNESIKSGLTVWVERYELEEEIKEIFEGRNRGWLYRWKMQVSVVLK